MSNLPTWAWGILAVLAIILIGVVHMGSGPALKPVVTDVTQLAAQSQKAEEGFSFAPVAHMQSGEVIWGRFENVDIPLHYHGQDEVAYVLQGQFTLKFVDGSSSTAAPGQLIVFPTGVAGGISGSGDFLVFTTPPENEADTVWLEGPDAKPGAKAPSMEKPQIIDINQRIAQSLSVGSEGYQYVSLFATETGSVELFRIGSSIALHKHPKENHVLYVLKGRGKGTIGASSAEVGPGQIVVIPANVPHQLKRIGDEPLDFILFSTPPFRSKDIHWLK